MIRILLIRHAEPVMPKGPRRYLGQTDPPLSARGVAQAGELAKRLQKVPLAAVFSSDLIRSRETAAILAAGRAIQVQECRWLREINAGLWEMLTFEQARTLYPSEHATRERDLTDTPFPQGESLRDVESRVVPGFLALVERAAADQAAARQPLGEIVIVGHRAVNVVLLSHLSGRPLTTAFSIPQEYCAVTEIESGLGADGARFFDLHFDEAGAGQAPLGDQ